MTASRMGLALVCAIACGGVEPVGPSTATWPTTVQSESDGCTPMTGDAGGSGNAGSGGAVDESGCAGSSTGECILGDESCPCTPGGACNEGLMCISDVCVGMACPVGSDGCPCTPGGGCDPELMCVDATCVPG